MKNKTVVLDANVLISGIAFGGKPLAILHRALDRDFRSATGPNILNEVRHVISGNRSKVIADFENRGEIHKAVEHITASLTSDSFRGKMGFKLSSGDTINVIDKDGKEMLFRVFRIVAGMPILISPADANKDIGLMDRLLMAWQVFTGRFFKK